MGNRGEIINTIIDIMEIQEKMGNMGYLDVNTRGYLYGGLRVLTSKLN